MTSIVLTGEQNSILSTAKGPIAILDPAGDLIGWVIPSPNLQRPTEDPFTADEIAVAEEGADQSPVWQSTQQVLEHLKSLDRSQP